jgi:hypothetical protein
MSILKHKDPYEDVRDLAAKRGLVAPPSYVRVPVGLIRIVVAIVIAVAGAVLWARFGIPHG